MLGRKIVILKLYALTILGKNSKKSDVVRKSGLFAEYGGGYWHPAWIPSYPELMYR